MILVTFHPLFCPKWWPGNFDLIGESSDHIQEMLNIVSTEKRENHTSFDDLRVT